MKYVGSKGRHAREILAKILPHRKPGQTYVEPFVGGANTLQRVDGPRIGGDLHPHLIAMWREVSKGWIPPAPELMTEAFYKTCKQSAKDGSPLALEGFMGFALSYGGKWFGGYRRDKTGKRDYADEAHRAALKEFPKLEGVDFQCASYDALDFPPASLIYCDPPYRDTLGYSTGGFDHDAFWQWVRDMSAAGHSLFVSEYSAPSDFICIWQKSVKNTLDADTGAKGAIERLWVPNSPAK